ncbi:aspartic peptidase domain-containing protein [Apodospora peruviana]|uniref:Aspartic peptidase domain-containing protein n=1 Tax=Apodospora peruviana TaxID=516989 RepID=A0AAE0M1P1_9PEZI|nr:aspartic peptidase domain-containing protein [Apodospora peruviana]
MPFGALTFVLHGVIAMASLVAAAFPHAKVLENAPPGINYKIPKGTHPWTSTKFTRPSQNIQKIHGFTGTKNTNARSVAAVLGAHQRQVGGFGYENVTAANAFGTQYGTEVLWNGFRTLLLLDTGSSDTWAVPQSFVCIDYSGQIVPQVACQFGDPYPGDFSTTDLVTPDQHMYIQYGDGEVVTGPMGFSDITLGNMTIKKQETCLANTTYWFGNNQTSGLMGLAFPSLTNAYLGLGEDHDPTNQVQYSPLFTSMVNQGKVPPLFSIAIDRNSSGGMIAWGGMPPTTGLDMSQMATMDMIITNLIDQPITAYQYSFYTIIPDGWHYGQKSAYEKYPYIVDSGTTLCYLPPDLADAISAAFQPQAIYLWMYGGYFTSCDAIAPIVAVVLNGIRFFINTVDLIYRDMVDPLTGLCMTAIASGGTGPYILGDVFMQNALVVFDVGEAKMRFVPREFY